MTQNLPVIANLFRIDEPVLVRFREMLSPADRQALDELLDSTEAYHLAAKQGTSALPMEILLLTILMEEHKMVRFLFERLNYYDQKLYANRQKRP